MSGNTRLTITLNSHTHAVIAELAKLQGRPKSKVITELLDTTVPVLERTCYVLGIAERASAGMNDDFKASLERSEAKVMKMMEDAMGQMDMLSLELSGPQSGGIGKGRQSASQAGADTSQPPHSNTGVTIGDNSKTSNKNKH